MRVLLDTNILLRIAEPIHAAHATAVTAVEMLHDTGHELYLVPQNVYEFWSVATRSVARNGQGKSVAQAEDLVRRFVNLFHLLLDERTIYATWLELVVEHEIAGVTSYDARLAAAMRRHGLDHLLTFNADDFRCYPHVGILEPDTVVASAA